MEWEWVDMTFNNESEAVKWCVNNKDRVCCTNNCVVNLELAKCME